MAVSVAIERYQSFDLGATKNRWKIATDGAETMVVSGEPHTTWGAAVITLYRSMDGVTPYALESAQTLAAAGMSATIDCSTVPFIIAELSTVGTASTYANLTASKSRSV